MEKIYTYSGMNYELNVANCLCDTSSVQGENITNDNKEEKSENLNLKTIAKTFASNLLNFNFDVIFCYNLVFDFQRLVKNIGFYIMLIMLILQIIFLTIFLIKKLKPIRDFMLQFSNLKKNAEQTLSSIKNNFNTNKNDNSRRKFPLKNEENRFAQQRNINSKNLNKNNNQINKEGKFVFINNFAPVINIQSNTINNTNKDNKNTSALNKIVNIDWKSKKNKRKKNRNNNKSNNINPENITETFMKNKSINYLETKAENKYKINSVKKEIIDVEDLLDMEYIQAINKDRSTFLILYIILAKLIIIFLKY